MGTSHYMYHTIIVVSNLSLSLNSGCRRIIIVVNYRPRSRDQDHLPYVLYSTAMAETVSALCLGDNVCIWILLQLPKMEVGGDLFTM